MEISEVQPGDLIQLRDWFGDAWAEVRFAFTYDPARFYIGYARRNKYGVLCTVNDSTTHRPGVWLGETIRRVAKAHEVDPLRNNINLIECRVRCGTLWDKGKQIHEINGLEAEKWLANRFGMCDKE